MVCGAVLTLNVCAFGTFSHVELFCVFVVTTDAEQDRVHGTKDRTQGTETEPEYIDKDNGRHGQDQKISRHAVLPTITVRDAVAIGGGKLLALSCLLGLRHVRCF